MDFDKEFEEFRNKRKEVQEKMEKAINGYSFDSLVDTIMIKTHIDEVVKEVTEITYSSDDGAPCIAMRCSRIGLALAISQLMNYNNDFYGMLRLVCRMRELEEIGSIRIEGKGHLCESEEEFNVLKEMANKSPEELEKLKEELSK